MRVNYHEPMARHTTWKIGGQAEIFYVPESKAELQQLIIELDEQQQPFIPLGGGSNILVRDEGIKEAVIDLSGGLRQLSIDGCTMIAEAGVPLPVLAYRAAEAGLAGLEFAAGIPGTVGGATVMNAGAHGQQMADLVRQVHCYNRHGESVTLSKEECGFAYRKSRFKEGDLVIAEVILCLLPGKKEDIRALMQQYQLERKQKQPLDYPSGGSVFQNPPGDSAGRLIEAVGAKGWRVGDAVVSTKHGNFIVNVGQATSEDVTQLVKQIKEAVQKQFQIDLREEFLSFPPEN